jgi:hypothetical protein
LVIESAIDSHDLAGDKSRSDEEEVNGVTAFLLTEPANRAEAQFNRAVHGVYEVECPDFTARIRHGTGHRKGILVTLLPISEKPADIADLTSEIGLGVIAEFHGGKLTEVPLNSEEDYLRVASLLAASAERFLLAYLLHLKNDFEQVKQFSVNSRKRR